MIEEPLDDPYAQVHEDEPLHPKSIARFKEIAALRARIADLEPLAKVGAAWLRFCFDGSPVRPVDIAEKVGLVNASGPGLTDLGRAALAKMEGGR